MFLFEQPGITDIYVENEGYRHGNSGWGLELLSGLVLLGSLIMTAVTCDLVTLNTGYSIFYIDPLST